MSLMQTIVTTIARYWPDKKRDPLIDHVGFVGKPVERVDALAKVKGEARFTAEFKVANLAYAVLVLSTIAKGKELRVNKCSNLALTSAASIVQNRRHHGRAHCAMD